MTEQQQQKQQAIDLLETRYRGMENVCEAIDMRLRMYFEDLLQLFAFCKKIPKKFGDIKEIAYLCTVKTFKGHEAAAPKKAAYFMHGLKKQAIAAPRGVSDNDPKGTSLE